MNQGAGGASKEGLLHGLEGAIAWKRESIFVTALAAA